MKQAIVLKKLCLGVVGALAMAGCYRHSYQIGNGGNTNKEAEYSSWESHWLGGLIGESDVDVKAVCPSGNATIKDRHSFLNLIVTSLIGVIYSPTTVEVYCGDGSKAALTFSPEQMRAIGLKPETMSMARSISDAKAAELQSAIDTFQQANKNVASSATPSRL